MGVHSGPPEHVTIEFESAVADYVRARDWHPSQQVTESSAGGLVMQLHVCLDQALLSWILGFGPFARVVAPDHLSSAIAKQLAEARARYSDDGST